MFFSYKKKAEHYRNKIIKRNVKSFKKLCLKKFNENINRGIETTFVDFFNNVDINFENEISEIVLKELKEENKNIEFSFSYRHYQNSYQGIKMIAK